eukprot:9253180-Heterocapsa_arctica.AAC.1
MYCAGVRVRAQGSNLFQLCYGVRALALKVGQPEPKDCKGAGGRLEGAPSIWRPDSSAVSDVPLAN